VFSCRFAEGCKGDNGKWGESRCLICMAGRTRVRFEREKGALVLGSVSRENNSVDERKGLGIEMFEGRNKNSSRLE